MVWLQGDKISNKIWKIGRFVRYFALLFRKEAQ